MEPVLRSRTFRWRPCISLLVPALAPGAAAVEEIICERIAEVMLEACMPEAMGSRRSWKSGQVSFGLAVRASTSPSTLVLEDGDNRGTGRTVALALCSVSARGRFRLVTAGGSIRADSMAEAARVRGPGAVTTALALAIRSSSIAFSLSGSRRPWP